MEASPVVSMMAFRNLAMAEMKQLNKIRRRLMLGQFEFSWHAFLRAVERNISDEEIRQAGTHAVLIEDYSEDIINTEWFSDSSIGNLSSILSLERRGIEKSEK